MPFEKGKVSNPAGGKRKGRRLSKILEEAGGKAMLALGDDGVFDTVIPEEHLAEMLWSAAINKVFRFKSGKTEGDEWIVVPLGFKNWLDLAQFLYKQIDGAPGSAVDHSGEITHVFTVEEWEAKRLQRLQAVAMLPDVDNSFASNLIVDIQAKKADEEKVSEYDNKEFMLKDEE